MKRAEVVFEFDEKEIDFSQDIVNLLLYNKGFSASANSMKIAKFTILNTSASANLQLQKSSKS